MYFKNAAMVCLCILCIPRWTIIAGPAADAMKCSIAQAVVTALEQNPKVRQYDERLRQRQCENRAATANFLPSVSLNTGYNVMDDPLTMDLDPIRSAMIALQSSTMTRLAVDSVIRANGGSVPASLMNTFQKQYSAAAAAGLDNALAHFVDTLKEQRYPHAEIMVIQPIFMGGKLVAAKRAAGADERGSICELLKIRNDVTQETFNNYCTMALLKQVVNVRYAVLDGMNRHRKDAQGLCEAGIIPKTSLLRADVAVAEAKRNCADDESRLAIARLALVKSMHLPDTTVVDITDSLTVHTLDGTCDEYIAVADSVQPLLGFVRTRRDAARAKVLAEQSSMLPQIVVFGKYELFPEYLSALEPHWTVGMHAGMELFPGYKNWQHYSSARHLLNETASLIENVDREVHLWVRKSFIECGNANARYEKLLSDESLAEENLRQCRSRFESGYGTALDVIDAELALEKNRIDKITALYDFHRSFMDLYTAMGKPENAVEILFSAKESL